MNNHTQNRIPLVHILSFPWQGNVNIQTEVSVFSKQTNFYVNLIIIAFNEFLFG